MNWGRQFVVFLSVIFFGSVTELPSRSVTGRAQEAQPTTLKRKVELKWEPIENANSYQLQVFKEIDGEFKSDKEIRKTGKNRWTGYLQPGRYQILLRALDVRDVPGKWGAPIDVTVYYPEVEALTPKSGAVIDSQQNDKDKVTLTWKPFPEQVVYKLRVQDRESGQFSEHEAKEGKIEISLPVGKRYKWEVWAVSSGGDDGDMMLSPLEFTLTGGRLETPALEQESLDSDPKSISWTAPKDAEVYAVRVWLRKDGEKSWERIVDKTQTDPQWLLPEEAPFGMYRLAVQARAKLRKPSKPMIHRFTLKDPSTGPKKKTEPKAKAAPPPKIDTTKERERSHVTFAYSPLFRRYLVREKQVDSVLNILVPNSFFMTGQYWFGEKVATGIEFTTHRIRASLFEVKRENSAQHQITVDDNGFTLKVRHRIGEQLARTDFGLGISQKNFHTFYQEGPGVIDGQRNVMQEWLVDGQLGLYFPGRKSLVVGVEYGVAKDAAPISIQRASFYQIFLVYNFPFFIEHTWLSSFTRFESRSVIYNEGIYTGERVDLTVFAAGLGITYSFPNSYDGKTTTKVPVQYKNYRNSY